MRNRQGRLYFGAQRSSFPARNLAQVTAMTLQELEKQLLALTPAEKAQALRVLVLDLAAWPGSEKTPGVVGGEARIVRTRIPVWVLDGYRRADWSEAQLLDNFPTSHAADLVNAWAYADVHPEEIERAQRENAEA